LDIWWLAVMPSHSTGIHVIQINLIDIDNLKKNKRATGRPQDLVDAENLE